MAFRNKQPVLGWRIHNTHDRAAMFYDRHIDREFAILVHEFLGAIERVDQRKPITMFGHLAFTEGFLRHHGEIRFCLSETFQDQFFRALVGFGYW